MGLRGLQVRLGCTTKILTRRCRCRLSFDGQPLPAPSTDLGGLSGGDLDRVVDERWDPPVTLGVRLVSVVADDLQHVGQAAFARGLL